MTTISQVTAAPVQPLSPDANVDRQIEFLRKVIKNMTSMSGRKLLIGGDTGIGKTSFAKQFARMLGMPIVIIEIPHIVEEELINIPYIVYEADGGTKEGVEQIPVGTAGEDGVKDIKVVMAKSWLAGHLESINKMSDAEYQGFVEQLDPSTKNLLDIYTQEYPDDIKTVRGMYSRILFFDEFFRQSTPTIKNILRNVLNGQIGNDKIPPGTYTMYASNLSDAAHGAIDKQLGNEEYDEPEFKPPTAKEWLDYTIGQSTSNINWHPDVVKAFKDAMSDTAVSYNDANAKIRTSPRRWSDIMIYVNSLYPFETPRDAGVAQFVLRRQFQNEAGKTSAAYKILEYILNELIKKSGHKKVPVVSGEDWQDVLLQNLMVKQTAGEAKKYVPVIQGAPGIGKTSVIRGFEEPPYNMRVIPILASTLSADSITGLPTTKLKDKEGKKLRPEEMQTHFSEPPLYLEIHNKIVMAEKAYYNELKLKERQGELDNKTADQAFSEFKSQPYKYVIFFDEINRVKNVGVFNSLRRLILEKEFNSRYKLPKDAIVVAAMNPSDIKKSTIGLTDHFRDAIDLIDVEPKWETTVKYFKDQVVPALKKAPYKPVDDAINLALKLIENFPKQFSDKHQTDDEGKVLKTYSSPEFYINVGGVDRPYMSPRAYDDTFKSLVASLDGSMKYVIRKMDRGENVSDDEINLRLANSAKESFMDYFRNLFRKEDITPIGFEEKLDDYIAGQIDVSLEAERTTAGIGGMLDIAINGDQRLADNVDFRYYMDSYVPSEFSNEFEDYLEKKIKDAGGSENNPESMMDFFIDRGVGSFYQIAKEIRDAVDENNYEPEILDQVALSASKYFMQANKKMAESDFDEDAIEVLVDNFFEIVDKVLKS